MEIAYNGNGALLYVGDTAKTIDYDQPEYALTYLFIKPNNSGPTYWPKVYNSNWNKTLLMNDDLFSFLSSPAIDRFFTLSHTFSHLALNNVSKSDVVNEIFYNQKFAGTDYLGLDARQSFSPHALITPAITGLLNGEGLAAFAQQGLNSIVGDNSRGQYNQLHRHWPLMSTIAANGYEGFAILPRYATEVKKT